MTATLVQSLFSSHPALVETALEVAVKAAFLCLAFWIAHLLAGRNRLLLRSALWHLCLLGLLLLPAAVVVFPRFDVAAQYAATGASTNGRTSGELNLNRDADGFASIDVGNTDSAVSASTVTGGEPELEMTATETARPQAGIAPRSIVSAVAAAYLLVITILLVRLTVSLSAVVALRRQSRFVDNPAWLQALARWQAELHLPSFVELRQTESVSVPVVVGWRRPTVILPVGMAQTADGMTIDAVLLHELTHLARGDYVWNLLLRFVSAVYWPHPGAWLAGRMVRRIREDICDAVCVHWMGDARRYCGVLADVAVGLRRRPEAALGIAMTRSSRLSRRLSRIERNPGTDRGLLAGRARIAIAAVVVVVVGALGSVHLVARAAGDEESLRAAKTAPAQIDSGLEDREPAAADPVDVDRQPEDSTNPPSKSQAADEASPDKSKPSRLKAVKVQRGTLQITTTQPASLEPFGEISIHSRNAGVVSKVMVNVGDRVHAGDVLAELDALDISAEIAEKEAALALAEADEERAKVAVEAAKAAVQTLSAKLAQAEAEGEKAASYEKFRTLQYDRIKKLFETKSIDERLVDEKSEQLQSAKLQTLFAVATIASAKAVRASGDFDVRLAEASLKPAALRVASVRADLKRTQSKTKDDFRLIRSPIDGVVLEKNIDLDVNVKSGDGKPLFRLAGTGLITAVVLLPERAGLLVERNNAATLEIEALGKAGPIAGKVSRIAYSFDRATRTLRTEISLPNADGKLKPGMYGRATVVVEEISDVLSVPVSAVGAMDGNSTAAIVLIVNRRAVRTPVKRGRNNGNQVEITEGLSEGDVVVAEFQKAPPDGEPLLDPARGE